METSAFLDKNELPAWGSVSFSYYNGGIDGYLKLPTIVSVSFDDTEALSPSVTLKMNKSDALDGLFENGSSVAYFENCAFEVDIDNSKDLISAGNYESLLVQQNGSYSKLIDEAADAMQKLKDDFTNFDAEKAKELGMDEDWIKANLSKVKAGDIVKFSGEIANLIQTCKPSCKEADVGKLVPKELCEFPRRVIKSSK